MSDKQIKKDERENLDRVLKIIDHVAWITSCANDRQTADLKMLCELIKKFQRGEEIQHLSSLITKQKEDFELLSGLIEDHPGFSVEEILMACRTNIVKNEITEHLYYKRTGKLSGWETHERK